MSSVTDRISMIEQPYGGFLKASSFEKTFLNDGKELNETENISSSLVGLAVDYLSRFLNGASFREAFEVSLRGLINASRYDASLISANEANSILTGINGLDDKSVINVCKLVSFDIWARNQSRAKQLPPNVTIADQATVQNIQIMVQRSLDFFKKYGPIVEEGFRFDPISEQITDEDGNTAYNLDPFWEMMETGKGSYGGYTPTVEAGEGDFLTKDTLWDFKVVKSNIKSQTTLQLLMYWIMGQHSGQEIYKGITKLGVFNPRLNIVYLYDVNKLPAEVIRTVEQEVICYPE